MHEKPDDGCLWADDATFKEAVVSYDVGSTVTEFVLDADGSAVASAAKMQLTPTSSCSLKMELMCGALDISCAAKHPNDDNANAHTARMTHSTDERTS